MRETGCKKIGSSLSELSERKTAACEDQRHSQPDFLLFNRFKCKIVFQTTHK